MSQPRSLLMKIGILLWTLLPCLMIWIGMRIIGNALWSFVLYHGVCLIPGIIWGKRLWQASFKRPAWTHLALLLVLSAGFSLFALVIYEKIGTKLLSDDHVLSLLKKLGYSKEIFWPLSIYLIVGNSLLEELFWRGVVLNELESWEDKFKSLGIVWSSFTYALYHYIIFSMVLFPFWAELGTFILALFGVLLVLVYRRSGSIITTSIAHGLLTDTAVIVLILDLLRRHPGALNQ